MRPLSLTPVSGQRQLAGGTRMDSRWAAIRNNGLASAVLVRVVQPRCLPRTLCCSLAAVAIDTCWRCLGRWPKPWGWAARPEAPHRNASNDSHPGIAWCSPGLVGGRPPPGGPSGRPPAPRTPSDMAFGARTRKLLIGYTPASTTGGRGRLPLNLEPERQNRRRLGSRAKGFLPQPVKKQFVFGTNGAKR